MSSRSIAGPPEWNVLAYTGIARSAGSDGLPTTNFTIQEVTTTQPVDWPELSTTQKLTSTTSSGTTNMADSTSGQNAAYYYISYQLITRYYILGAQGNYIDDIHYYFTGSNNTFLDYHTFDPASLTFPGSSPTACYQWTDPVPGRGTPACFTQNDFNAVRAQMHNEIVYLTNVLQFMVNGSTNMKDLVASGNGSAALALINAAATVEASTLQPPPATPVKFNISNILNLVGNAELNAGAIVSELRKEIARHEDAVASAHGQLIAYRLPGANILDGAIGQMKAILRGSEDNAIATFNASHRSIKEAIKRAGELEQALSEPRLRDLERAREALRTAWPFLSEESDVSEELRSKASTLEDLLARETFYRELPVIDQHTPAIEAEYERRYDAAMEARIFHA